MKITTVTVGYSETITLPDYCNARPSMSLSADLEEGESWEKVRLRLDEQVRAHVRAEVDRLLEANDKPPKHYDGPRYQVMENRRARAIILLRDDGEDSNDWPDGYTHAWDGGVRGIRREVAERKAKAKIERREGWRYFDCSDGDYSKLPLEEEEEIPDLPF